MTASGMHGMLATKISGSLTLSQRGRLQVNLFIADFASACVLRTNLALNLSHPSFFYSL